MIGALVALAAVCVVLALTLAYVLRTSGRDRAQLVTAVISKHAGEAVALGLSDRPRPTPRSRDGEPPPGTLPVGLDGGF